MEGKVKCTKLNFESVFYIFLKELKVMGTIICQTCEKVIEHINIEKVVTLYGKCTECSTQSCRDRNN
ncbi:GapA-binding peptide SR1P [Alteribacillus bidgolensis]|uniref:GapA-binding peptide SR1P n=1 Tax=Alteribacillus bidgolensis TaxID=930129 RepID=UPI003F5D2AF2